MKLEWKKVEIPLVRKWNNFHMMEIESHGIVDGKREDMWVWVAMACVGCELDGKKQIQLAK